MIFSVKAQDVSMFHRTYPFKGCFAGLNNQLYVCNSQFRWEQGRLSRSSLTLAPPLSPSCLPAQCRHSPKGSCRRKLHPVSLLPGLSPWRTPQALDRSIQGRGGQSPRDIRWYGS